MLKIIELTCNGLREPIGLDRKKGLTFAWKFTSDRKNVAQTAYHYKLTDDAGTVIESGSAKSADQHFRLQNDINLESSRFYTFEIAAEAGDDSAEASCSILFGKSPDEWDAKWIGVQRSELDGSVEMVGKEEMVTAFMGMVNGDAVSFKPDRQLDPVRIFRKEFHSESAASKAFLSITAHGIYEAKINGEKVSDTCFAPGFTVYQDYLEFQTYDVSGLVKEGDNVLTVKVADGWYKGKFGILGYGNNYGIETSLLAQLDITYADGTTASVTSDESFRYAESSILYSDILIGEKQDTRINDRCWDLTGTDIGTMRNAEVKEYGFDNLRGITDEPVRCIDERREVNIFTSPKGECIADMGQNIVGVVRLRVKGQPGEVISLQHSEVLDEEGNYINNISGANRDQEDIFILNGEEQVIMPRFTFHGFRYVKISGYSGVLKNEDVTGIVIGTDLKTTGTFTTSDPLLNQLQSNIFWSQRGNMLSIPTDCPQRERAGWTGDIQIYGATAAYNQNVNQFLRKWLENVSIEQFDDGEIPVVIPYPTAYSAIQRSTFGSDTSAGWGDAVVMLPWTLYQVYGDKDVLSENWDMMKRWMDYVEKHASEEVPEHDEEMTDEWYERQKYLWNTGFHFGDWLYPSCKNEKGESDMFRSAYTTKDYTATAMYAQSVSKMISIADILGEKTREEHYIELLNNIRRAFAEEFIDADGRIGNAPQGVYVLALAMKMGSPMQLEKVAERLDQMIHENGDRLDTGFLSIPYLMDVLMEYGYAETAKKVLYQDACPSWLYEVKNGATTMWERWDAITPEGKITDSSYNHYAFGCIGDWMYRTLLGLRSTEPGYRKVKIAPAFTFDLTCCEGSFDSTFGTYKVSWKLDNNEGVLDVEIPVGAEAEIDLPGLHEYAGSGRYTYRFNLA